MQLAPSISRALRRSGFERYNLADVIERLHSGRMQLWLGVDDDGVRVCVITEVSDYPRARTCGIFVCIGSGMAGWLHCLAEIEAWAKRVGCRYMVNIAREGWARTLKPLGYKKTHVVLEKEL